MGSSFGGGGGGGGYVQSTVVAEDSVTPAVARDANAENGGKLSANQQEAKSRLRGIRSTYNRFGETPSAGTTNKLG